MSRGAGEGMKRRDFIRYSSFGLALGSGGISVLAAAKTSAPANSLNPYVMIHDDGRIVIAAPNPDVGQGVNTALPMIVAEELDADWQAVEVVLAPIDANRYGAQFAGGSLSVRNRWNELRRGCGRTGAKYFICGCSLGFRQNGSDILWERAV